MASHREFFMDMEPSDLTQEELDIFFEDEEPRGIQYLHEDGISDPNEPIETRGRQKDVCEST